MKTCLVIGATGFIGGQIARAAAGLGWQTRALRRRPGAAGAIGDVQVEWWLGDLADGASLATAMQGCDVVFHAAGAYPHGAGQIAPAVQAASQQMRTTLDAFAASGAGRLIYTSSFTTIGRPGTAGRLACEQDAYVPGSAQEAYHEAKWAMETMALGSGLPVTALCPTAVFGPGDVHLSVGQILLLAAKGRIPVYVDATLNVVDVRDVAQAHLAAATQGSLGERYLIGGHNVTLYQALALTARLAQVAPPRWRLHPRLLQGLLLAARWLPVRGLGHLRSMSLWQPLDNGKAVRELGLAPRPLEQTIADALAWFRQVGYLAN